MAKSNEARNKPFPTALRSLMVRGDQMKLAEHLRVSDQTIRRYCNGVSGPTPEMLAGIARYFDVSADYLLGLSEKKRPDVDALAVSNRTGLSESSTRLLIEDGELGASVDALIQATAKTRAGRETRQEGVIQHG